MAALAGYNGRVSVGTIGNLVGFTFNLPTTSWQVTTKVDPIDVTTVESNTGGGLAQTVMAAYTPGVTDMDITFDCYWDTTLSPISTGATPNLYPGSRARVALYLNRTAGVLAALRWDLGVLVTDVNMSLDVRGVVRYSVSAKPGMETTAQVGLVNSPAN